MTEAGRVPLVPATRLTWGAAVAAAGTMAFTGAFLLARFDVLPDLLPVRFNALSHANGWQYKTYPRVLMPVLVQAALASVFGAVALLLLWRPHAEAEHRSADMNAAAVAAEAVVLVAAVWVAFQAYAAVALTTMWQRGTGGLGRSYGLVTWLGIAISIAVFFRAQKGLGCPEPRPFDPAHWHFGALYRNAADPALFVPTRDGRRWTLNFGRPVAAALMGLILAVGIVGPTIILALLLRF
jgi:uncharacterized membrane protein